MIDDILSDSGSRRLVGGAIGLVIGLLIWGVKLLWDQFKSSRRSARKEEQKHR